MSNCCFPLGCELFPRWTRTDDPPSELLDDAKCYDKVRELRWPEGVKCPHCASATVTTQQGRDTTQPARRKYRCTTCGRYFDDLTGTVLAGHHQPVQVWILCLYLSNAQIAQALGLHKDAVQSMASHLRAGIVAAQPTPELSGEVECDEVYIVAGHKGHPDAVKKKPDGTSASAQGRARRRHLGEREASRCWDYPTRR